MADDVVDGETQDEVGATGRPLSRRSALALLGGASAAAAIAGRGAPSAFAGALRNEAAYGGTGTAVLGYGFEPTHIDPAQVSLAGESTVVNNLYDSLFSYEGFPPKRINRLVQDYKVSKDGRTYDFRIRNNVTFHDGSKLTAADVVYSFTRILELQTGPYSIWQGIITPGMLSAPTTYTFRIKMPRPYAALPDTLAWLHVVNKNLVSANESGGDFGKTWLDQNDAGSGAFTLASYQKGTRLAFERFPKYYRGWKASYLDGWVYNVTREPATIRLGLQNGSVSLSDLYTLTIDDLLAASRSGGVTMDSYPGLSVVSIKQNNQKGPTNNKMFRKAVSYAFDYNAIVKGLMRGQTDRQYGAYPKGYRYFKDFEHTPKAYNTNLEQARAYLAKSGVNVKKLGPLGYMFRGDDATQKNYGLVLKSSLAKIGVNVELQGVSISELLGRLTSPDVTPHFTRISNSSLVTDPDLYARQYLWSKQWAGGKGKWYTATYYKNPKVDRLIEQARFEANQAKRAQMYQKLQDIVYDDAADVWVDQTKWLVDRRSNLKGFVYHGLGAVPISFAPMYFNPPQ